MASIPLGFAGKAPQEGFQEEEVEHGAFCAALRQASMEADARGGTMRFGNAHCGAAANEMEELYKLLRDPHVAQEESQRRKALYAKRLVSLPAFERLSGPTSIEVYLTSGSRYRTTPCGTSRTP